MTRPGVGDWQTIGLDGDPTPGVVESVQALAKMFHDFADDAESAWRSVTSFGADTTALSWIGQSADAFKSNFGPLPGRMQKLYTSYREAGDALDAYWPKLQAAQSKADAALRDGLDAHADVQRLSGTATTAADALKQAQTSTAGAAVDPAKVQAAQTAHDTAQHNLDAAKSRLAAATAAAHGASDDRIAAAKDCAKALHHAQSDGIHNKSWWDHVGEALSDFGGKLAEYAGDVAMVAGALAPLLDILAVATAWIPGVDVITAGLAAADNVIADVAGVLATAGTVLEMTGDGMQGHWGDALLDGGMLALQFGGGRLLGKLGKGAEGDSAALSGEAKSAENDIGNDVRGAEGKTPAKCETDPVDVVSGQMLATEIDVTLPGVLSVVLRRTYASGYETGRLFGPAWSSTLDQRVAVNAAGIHFAGDDAETLHYPIPVDSTGVLPERGARWPLVWDRELDEIRITDPVTGHIRCFPTVHHGDERGQIRDLTAIVDRHGNRIDIRRAADGTPTAVEHAGYRLAIDTVTTAAGPRISGLRLQDESEQGVTFTRFGYDRRGRLTDVVDSTGTPYRYEHDDAGRITGWIDRTGYRYTYEYDSVGRCVRTSGDGGYLSGSFVYDYAGRTTAFTNSLGAVTTYRYDELGHVTSTTDALGNVTLTDYDDLGRLRSTTSATGAVTRNVWDENGDLVCVEHPDGSSTRIEYNDLHQPVRVTGPDGTTRTHSYDAAGNPLESVDESGAVSRLEWDDLGRLVAVVDPLGHRTTFQTDAAGLPVAVTDPDGYRVVATRDALGRVAATADTSGATTSASWTVEGRPAAKVAADGAVERWHRDAAGRAVEHVDAAGRTTVFEYGPFGKIVARTDPNGERYRFDYDTELRLVAVTNAAGATWRYTFDAAGRVVSETDFAGRVLAYRYDAAGQLVARRNGLGQVTELIRDLCGRVVERRTDDGATGYEYDRAGRLLAVRGPSSTVLYTRDAAGRILRETVDGRTVAYEYDRAGRRIARSTPGGAVSGWEFDAAGRPTALAAGTGRIDLRYDASGRETARSFGPDVWLSRSHDAAGRLVGQRLWTGDRDARVGEFRADLAGSGSAAADATVLFERSWSYAADGTPTETADSLHGARSYQSDELGRVTAVSAADWTERYAYDAFGNLAGALSPAPAAEETNGERENAGTRVRRGGRTHYEHDGQGRLVRVLRRTLSGQRREWSYRWDADDRLREVVLPDGTVWRYDYDPLGRRVAKFRVQADGTPGDLVRFAWDGTRLAEQESAHPDGGRTALVWDYEPGTWRPAAQRRRSWALDAPQGAVDEIFHAVVTDLAGAPTELVTPDGRVAWSTVTDLYGHPIRRAAEPGVDCPLGFPGQYRDAETGLSYNLNRYYDPATAAYLTPDPLGLGAGPNDHAYVPNPLVWIDPLGLSCTDPVEPSTEGIAVVHGHAIPGAQMHFTVEVMDAEGNITHSELMPSIDHRMTPIRPYVGAPGSIKLTFQLPDASAARAFQAAKIGTEQGHYDWIGNSCLTHVADVLRAGGVTDIPTDGKRIVQWANRDGMKSTFRADG